MAHSQMHLFYRLSIFITYYGIFVCCQRGSASGIKGNPYKGGIGAGSFTGGGGSNGNSNSCKGSGCGHTQIIVFGAFGGISGILTLISIGRYYCKRYTCRSLQRNSTFTGVTKHKGSVYASCDIAVFKSGSWSSRYLQFGVWHGPDSFPLSFDAVSYKVTGCGSDEVGVFIIDGTYSNTTGRMNLIKKYQLGTGDPLGNLGHQVTIQLAWNPETCQFEGKWYVRTKSYRGKDKFELKFNPEPEIFAVFPKQ